MKWLTVIGLAAVLAIALLVQTSGQDADSNSNQEKASNVSIGVQKEFQSDRNRFLNELPSEFLNEFRRVSKEEVDIDKQVELIRTFAKDGPESYGQSSVEIIGLALDSSNSETQFLGLASLHRLWAVRPDAIDVQSFSAAVTSLLASNDEKIRVQAIAVASAMSNESDVLENELLAKLKSARDENDKAEILLKLPVHMVRKPDTTEALLNLAKSKTDRTSFNASRALIRSNVHPTELLPELVRLIQNDLFYGRSVLTTGIQAYGKDAVPYLPLIKEVHKELKMDLQRSPPQRTKNIVRNGSATNIIEEPHALQALDDLVGFLESL